MIDQNNYYAKLNGKVVEIIDGSIPEALVEWAKKFEDIDHRRIGYDTIGALIVSTVFLGINHGFGGEDLWFETMVFGDESEYCQRYTTYDQAVAGHARVVEILKSGKKLSHETNSN